MKTLLISVFFFISVVTDSLFGQYLTNHPEFLTPYSPSDRPRMAAEWEPALGTLIAWPLSIPYKLVIELARDNKLYVLISDRKAQKDAITWFTKWGITPDKVRFIGAPQGEDVSWTRDWGPHAVFAPTGTMKLADGRYLYSTPVTGLQCDDTLEHIFLDQQNKVILTQTDDRIPEFISNALNLEMLNLPFAFTGGNVISDGQRTGFSTCALTNENRFTGITDEKFFHDVRLLLGIENYHIISNFEEKGIQHIDCYMKLLDEERILVMRPPADHPAYEQYEGIITHELSHLKNAYGRPYQILRMDTDRYDEDQLAAYTNALILNQVIYVPLFGIPQDKIALQQWSEAMPGYMIKGFEFVLNDEPVLSPQVFELYKNIGWKSVDALHCRTRAIWDPEMIYMSVDRVPSLVPMDTEKIPVTVLLKDYSGKGFIPESLILSWRIKGEKEWKNETLVKSVLEDQYVVSLPGGNLKGIEYYVAAESYSGRKETMPRTAPGGLYHFNFDIPNHK